MSYEILVHGPTHATWALILAHGAGAPMDSAFMNTVSRRVGEHSVRVVRFEFPYMRKRRESGGRRPPDRMPVLQEAFREIIGRIKAPRIAIGGKSMGGRVASMLAAEDPDIADAVVCLGYPFHPPGKPGQLRTEHLADLQTPTLIVQGTRDALGSREEVEGYRLSSSIRLHWLEDGDHSFKPRKSSGFSQDDHLETAADTIAEFLRRGNDD